MEFHFLLRILLHSLVRMKWFAAESSDRRRQENIMNAFIGRLGFPSAFKVGTQGRDNVQRVPDRSQICYTLGFNVRFLGAIYIVSGLSSSPWGVNTSPKLITLL